MRYHYAHYPNPNSQHSTIIRDLLEISRTGHQDALNAIIKMLEDFEQHSTTSRFLRKLQGIPLHELKTQSRGGIKGGSRVYLYVINNLDCILINAEVKPDKHPNPNKLKEALEIVLAFRQGQLQLQPALEEA
jgi:hypothetical protein